jgi:hypothetical protein
MATGELELDVAVPVWAVGRGRSDACNDQMRIRRDRKQICMSRRGESLWMRAQSNSGKPDNEPDAEMGEHHHRRYMFGGVPRGIMDHFAQEITQAPLD